VPASLQDSARDAAAKGEPLVLLVSLPGCPYCELVRRSYLLPMRAEGLQAFQINVTDNRQPVRDFAGAVSSGAALAREWKATFTPTVLFFDARGHEIAQRLVGVAVPDFYGAYLDAELANARGKLGPKRGS
jgi:thioredoxin-related protein